MIWLTMITDGESYKGHWLDESDRVWLSFTNFSFSKNVLIANNYKPKPTKLEYKPLDFDRESIEKAQERKIKMLRDVLAKFTPCDENGNGEFLYNEGSEYLGADVLEVLKATGPKA